MNEFSWLKFNDANLIICKLCYWGTQQNGTVMYSASKFMLGSSNYQKSTLKDHNLSAPHDLARKSKENFDVQKASSSIPPRKVVQQITAARAIAKFVRQMNEMDWATVMKLHGIAYYIALDRLPFTQFEYQVKFEKLHNVTFIGAYKNESACWNFIIDIKECFFQEDVEKKIKLINFIAILCDGQQTKTSLSKR